MVDGREKRWEGETEFKKERERKSNNQLGIVKVGELVKMSENFLESRIQNRKPIACSDEYQFLKQKFDILVSRDYSHIPKQSSVINKKIVFLRH